MTYTVVLPDGQEAEFPDNVSHETAAAVIARQFPQFKPPSDREQQSIDVQKRYADAREAAAKAAALPPETTFGGQAKELFKGIIPGAVGLAETAGTGIAALLPEETEKAARGKIGEYAAAAKKPFEAAPGYEESVTRKLGEGLGSALPFFALGPFGAAGRIAGVGLGAAAGAGEARQGAEQAGATAEQRSSATAYGIIPGMFDMLAPHIKGFQGLITTALARGGVEGATEAAQKVAQNLIARGIYKPDQPIFEGSGEEGAYGFGVGALASLIVDMTIGRRAHAAKQPPPPKPPTPPTEPPLQLGYTPFTPVVFPDGSTATTEQEADAYRAKNQAENQAENLNKRDKAREEDRARREERKGSEYPGQTPDMRYGFDTRPAQGELFSSDLERAQKEVDDIAGPPKPTEAAPAAAPAAAPDTRQQDFVEIQANERQAAQRLASDISEVDGRIRDRQVSDTEKTRLNLLLPIVDSLQRGMDVAGEFRQALSAAGITNLNLTPAEARVIKSAEAMRDAIAARDALTDVPATPATPATPAVLTAPSAPNELNAADVGIKERGDKGPAGVPAQRSTTEFKPRELPVVSKITPDASGVAPSRASLEKRQFTEAMQEQPEAPRLGVVSPKLLSAFNIRPTAPVYNRIINTNLTTPEGRTYVKQQLAEHIKLVPTASKRIGKFLASPIFYEQTSMFGPRGGVITGRKATNGSPAPAPAPAPATTQFTPAPTGESIPVPSRPSRARPTGGATPPANAGVAGSADTTAGVGGGETVQSDTLKKQADAEARVAEANARKAEAEAEVAEAKVRKAKAEAEAAEAKAKAEAKAAEAKAKAEAKAAEPKAAEPKAPKTKKPNTAWQELATEPLKAFNAVISQKYTTIAPKDVGTVEDYDTVGRLLRKASGELSSVAKAAQNYFSKMERTVDNLLNIAFDFTYNTERFRREYESEAEGDFFKGMNGANSRMARNWVKQSMSEDANKALDSFIVQYAAEKELTLEEYIDGILAQKTPEQADNDIQDYIDAQTASRVEALSSPLSDAKAEAFAIMLEREMANRGGAKLKLEQNAIVQLAQPLHPAVQGMLADNNLVGALNVLANSTTGIVSRIVKLLASVMGGVKVEVVTNLKDESGKRVGGMFDPKTNTIFLDSKLGMNQHVLIHEVVHAATAHVLSNPSHPVTRQLTQLFNDVKDSLDTAYGAQSLDEFVAEAFGNPEFRAKLQAINTKGGVITAWQRFTNTIANFLRRMVGMESRPIESAFDQADRLISAVISPSPQTRDAPSLYSESLFGRAGAILDNLGHRAATLPGMNEARISRLHEFFSGTIPNAAKNLVRMSLPLNSLVDLAKKYIPMAPEVDSLVNQRSGAESIRNQSIEPIIRRVESWSKENPSKVDLFNEVVYTSTLDQVDPEKGISAYAKDAEKTQAYKALASKWAALGTDGQAIYKMMRDSYAQMYKEIERVIGVRVEDSLGDKQAAAKVMAAIYKRLADRGGLEPYFPLTRKGKYWLSYHAFDPSSKTTEFYVEAYETQRDREMAAQELETAGAKEIQKFANLGKVNYKTAPPTSFVNSVLRTLETSKVSKETTRPDGSKVTSEVTIPSEVVQEIMELFLNTLPETSFAQSFRKRKGTLGFERDSVLAMRNKMYSTSRQLANMEYGAKLMNLKDKIFAHVKKGGNEEVSVAYADELAERIKIAVSPEVPMWSKVATSLGFNMTLGLNVSSAIVNMAQIPLIVMPYLGGKYGYSETARAIGRATRIFTNSGFEREIETFVPTDTGEKKVKVKAFPSLDNIDFDAKGTPAELKHYKTLSRIAAENGQLNRSQMYDILDVNESDSVMSKVNAFTGFIFHHGERMNRQVSLIAAYDLELQSMVGKGKSLDTATEAQRVAAAEYAIYLTEMTNGGTASAAAPRIAQSGLGKVIFMFKRYGVSMNYMLLKTARDALKDQNPVVRKAAMKQIAGIYASAALFAGAQGLPAFGLVAMLFNMFRDEDEDDFQTSARKWVGELMHKGLANELLGVEIASRVGLSDLIYRDQKGPADQTAIASLLETLGGPVLGTATRMERGLKLIGDGHVERGLEQMLPSAMGNMLKATRYATEGTSTLRGDPITGDISAANVFAQFFGFAPAEYTRQLEINANEKKIERTATQQRTKLLRNYYMATREGDYGARQDIRAEMFEFGQRHPGLKITPDTIESSMAQHKKTSREMYHGVTINKGMRAELMRNAAEYDGD